LRLAWAITIHKSQGLTFEKAIIDAGASFAAGQVYVALSRLTSLKGLVLYSRIHPNAIQTDHRVLEFVQKEIPEEELEKFLTAEQKVFVSRSLISFFDWNKVADRLQAHWEAYKDRLIPDKEKAIQWARDFFQKTNGQKEVAEKFIKQLEDLLFAPDIDYIRLDQRTQAAANYFSAQINELLASLQEHIDEVKIKKRVKKYLTELAELKLLLKRKQRQLDESSQLAKALANNSDTESLLEMIGSHQKEVVIAVEEEKTKLVKASKGESRLISLEMFKAGNDIAAIAKERGYATSTIEGHLASFIETGEITIQELLSEEKINRIENVIHELGDKLTGSKDVKDKLPYDYSYADIKSVMLHLKKIQV
jgi:hypothetical protein